MSTGAGGAGGAGGGYVPNGARHLSGVHDPMGICHSPRGSFNEPNVDERLRQIAWESHPIEACGFIIDGQHICEVENVASHPHNSFAMDASDVHLRLSQFSGEITGIWHTHPSGSTKLSSSDLDAIEAGNVNPLWDYYIVTREQVIKIAGGTLKTSQQKWANFVK